MPIRKVTGELGEKIEEPLGRLVDESPADGWDRAIAQVDSHADFARFLRSQIDALAQRVEVLEKK